jgi:chemotaxis signal transduction protein
MDSQELTAKILESSGASSLTEAQEVSTVKLIFFRVGESLYALPAEFVQEIMLDLTIHYIPFLPPLVRGLVNRLGEPITVVDLHYLIHRSSLNGKTFLILKPHISKTAFLIDSVQDIRVIAETEISRLVTTPESGNFGLGIVRYGDADVLVLNVEAVIETVKGAVRA